MASATALRSALFRGSLAASAPARTMAAAAALPPLRVAVAGPAPASLLSRIASGGMLGPFQPVQIRLLDDPNAAKSAKTVTPASHPLAQSISTPASPDEAYADADFIVLISSSGAALDDAAAAAKKHAAAISSAAKPTAKIAVAGASANTLALVVAANAPRILAENVFAVVRADHARVEAALAKKTSSAPSDIARVIVWGDGSVPDIAHATVKGNWALGTLGDRFYAQAIVEELKAAKPHTADESAAAIVDTVRDIWLGAGSKWTSIAGLSDGSYGIDRDIYYAVPCECPGGHFNRVYGVPIDEPTAARMNAALDKLKKERDAVRQFIPKTWTSVVSFPTLSGDGALEQKDIQRPTILPLI